MLLDRQPKNSGIIFSVFQGKDLERDKVNHDAVTTRLIFNKIPFKQVIEAYTHLNGKRVHEVAFYVDITKTKSKEIINYIESLCLEHNQESYLSLSPTREASLVYRDGQARELGYLSVVSKNEALESEAFTYDPITKSYFICKG